MDLRQPTPIELIPRPHIVHRMFSHRVLVTIILIILIATASYLWVLFQSKNSPVDFNFRVEKTDTIHTVANNLMTNGIINHRIFFYFSYYAFGQKIPMEPGMYKLSSAMGVRDIVHTLEGKPVSKYVEIPEGSSKEDIAEIMTKSLGWGTMDRQFFSNTYSGMQWQHYQEFIKEYFKKNYSWNDSKTNTFMTLSALYYDNKYDFLKKMYISGTYEIPVSASRAQVAGILIDRFANRYPNDILTLGLFIDTTSAQSVVKLIEDQMVLMPDIVTIPPQDVTLKRVGNRTYLLFTTSYWNKGRGPLEFVPDPKTKGMKGDHERTIFQRIYSLDGDYTERLSGKFLWHDPHLHYHFQDFAVYSLESVSTAPLASPVRLNQKSTFCIRDSEPIDLAHPGANKSASYTVCGKERQGISAGWADSYYYNYVDQKFDVTGLPKGEYKLKIVINPLNRFEEITKDNNVGEVVLNLDVENNKVTVISEKNYGI